MDIELPASIADASTRLVRLIAHRTRQVDRLVKAHALHLESRGRPLPVRAERILRCDRLLRDRFRDRVDVCTRALADSWRAGTPSGQADVMGVVERAVCAWPEETKVNAGLLLFLAEVVQEARDDAQVLRAWGS